jgi:hypothetical protein
MLSQNGLFKEKKQKVKPAAKPPNPSSNKEKLRSKIQQKGPHYDYLTALVFQKTFPSQPMPNKISQKN